MRSFGPQAALTLLCLIALVSPLAGAAPVREGIAAVVNDDVVSAFDVRERLDFSIIAAGLPNTPEQRAKLMPQVTQSLIDETLQRQEAERLDITVAESEVSQALERIAQDNGKSAPELLAGLRGQNVNPDTLLAQLRAGIAWTKVVQRTVRPLIDVGEDEVDSIIDRMRANVGKPEYLVSEIFLAVDTPADDARVRQLAEDLIQQLQGGAAFAALARQFSQNASSSAGGDLGWLLPGNLDPVLDSALQQMRPGTVSPPLRGASGWHILGLRDQRVTPPIEPAGPEQALDLRQLFLPEGAVADVAAEVQRLKSGISNCEGLDMRLAQFPAWENKTSDGVRRSALPSELQAVVDPLQPGDSTAALRTPQGYVVIYLCARTEVAGAGVNRQEIIQQVGLQKLGLQSRRLLRDLRRSAFIDVRL